MFANEFFIYMRDMVMDFFYPPHCPVCAKYIENREDILCSECERNILAVEQYPFKRQPLKEIWRLTRYTNGTRELILDLKFNKKMNILRVFENIIDKALITERKLIQLLENIDIATVVPLHAERERERGFNQVELIFDKLIKQRNISIEKLTFRTRMTEHLYDKNLQERQKELEGAFDLLEGAESKIKNKRILILDDIFTTGTTMSECAKILQINGAAEIYGLALASDFKD